MTATDHTPIVEEIVDALTGGDAATSKHDLKAQLQRAAREFDARTADSFCKALLEHLTEHPGGVRELEALMILGLAHPRLLSRHRIPLAQEGRRLAVLLEKQGEVERAQSLLEVLSSHNPDDRAIDHDLASMMRRTGNADRLVERYLRRAEESVRVGNRKDAITWLREVLLIDRSRRDVARMIRDLRYEEVELRAEWMRRLRLTAAVLAVLALGAGAVWRELSVDRAYAAIAPAEESDLAGLERRLAEVDSVIASNPLWLGMLAAARERTQLRNQVQKLQALLADERRTQLEAETQQLNLADSARLRGRICAERGDFDGALEQFRAALDAAPPGWQERARVEADIQAIVSWQARNLSKLREVQR